LLARLGKSEAEFDSYREEMREYRDKFVAHLDDKDKGQIPHLDIAKASIEFYHAYIVGNEAKLGDLADLPDSAASLRDYCQHCEAEAADIYPI
jgi:hypothetical protein